MLHEKTVDQNTLAILKKLMTLDSLQSFALAGGTNLSLRFGYRKSIDIDLFSGEQFDYKKIVQDIESNFDNVVIVQLQSDTITLSIQGVKVDCLLYQYPLLKPLELIDGIRLYHAEDISAMKCSALLGRSTKKDYRDIAHLLDYYSIQEICDFFQKKYKNIDLGALLRTIIYFDEADQDGGVIITLDTMDRRGVKKKITQAVQQYFNSL